MKRNIFHVSLTGVTNGSSIASIAAIAEKFQRSLSTNAVVFAWIRVAFVSHMAGVKYHLAFTTILFVLPIGRQSIITVNSDQFHAANESISGLPTADEIVRPGGYC
jgi:hypothetical protein